MALEQKEAELQCKEAELQRKEVELQGKEMAVTTLTDVLVQKDVGLEAQGAALHNAETALKEKEASLSALLEQADAARAQLEVEKECIEGKREGHDLLKLNFSLPKLILVFLFSTEEGSGGRDRGEGSPPGRAHVDAG